MLHLVFSVASVKTLTDPVCPGRLSNDDTLVLLGEAVAASLAAGERSAWLQLPCGQIPVYATREDLAGLNAGQNQLVAGVRTIDYAELVELTKNEQRIVSWS